MFLFFPPFITDRDKTWTETITRTETEIETETKTETEIETAPGTETDTTACMHTRANTYRQRQQTGRQEEADIDTNTLSFSVFFSLAL